MLGVVLAGGRGSRMGGQKATSPLAGRPLIAHPLESVRRAGLEPVVLAKPDSELPELGAPVVREPPEPVHPLAGVVAALAEAPIVAVAGDMPFVAPQLLAWLAEQADPLVVPRGGGRLHPLLARYHPDLSDALAAAAAAGRPSQEAVLALGPRIVEEDELRRFGDPDRLLFNVNTPDDLLRAEQLLRGTG